MSRNYMSYAMQVHDYLMELKSVLQEYSSEAQVTVWLENIEDLNRKLEDMHFQVAVVGEFKRGKTSLINALLRRQILPADVVPTTATINRITYGDIPTAYIYWNDGRVAEKVDIGQLSDYITKLTDNSAEQAKNIREAVVKFPCRFCDNNVDLIDTPGMNDDDLMNSVTIRGLSNIDLAIVTLVPESPISDTEARFIAQLVENEQICQIIFVLSKIDTVVGEKERDKIISFIKKRIRIKVREILVEKGVSDEVISKCDTLFSDVILFPVSSVLALRAYELGDQSTLDESGFGRLNEELMPIIIRSQHSAAILTPLRMSRNVCSEFQRCSKQWINKAERIRNMKNAFANTAYSLNLSCDSIWTECRKIINDQKQQHVRTVTDVFCKIADSFNSRERLMAKVKDYFQQFRTELPEEEKVLYQEVWTQFVLPVYDNLKTQLIEVVSGITMDFLPLLELDMDYLTDSSCYSSFIPQPEIFYWEKSPVPPFGTPSEKLIHAISEPVKLSFDNYYARREEKLSVFLKNVLSNQESRVSVLVQKLFKLAQERLSQEANEREVYEKVTRQITELAKRCGELEQDYLTHSGVDKE